MTRQSIFVGLFLAASLTCGCADAPARTDGGSPDLGSSDDLADVPPDAAITEAAASPDLERPLLSSGTYTFMLKAGAFPGSGHPDVLVYIPSRFDPTPPLDLVVYIHGFSNCVENIVRDVGQPCTAGGSTDSAYSLIKQFEAANKNALFIAPEVAYDQRSGAPGNLGKSGGFKALLAETLADLKPQLGTVTTSDVGKVVALSHSGGYQVIGDIATIGGVPIQEVHLLDSLYGSIPAFETWIKSDLPALTAVTHRFSSIYTCCSSGPKDNTQNTLIPAVDSYFPAGSSVIVDDRSFATWPDATYHHGVLFKYSDLSHNDVPRYYFGKLVATSVLPSRP